MFFVALSSTNNVLVGIIVDDFKSFSEKQRRWFTGATLDEMKSNLREQFRFPAWSVYSADRSGR